MSGESVSSGVSENSNLLRLNSILQTRVEDLTEKLRAALQAQKDHLEELDRSQRVWRADYSNLEDKYFGAVKECEQLKSAISEQTSQLQAIKESASTAAKKLTIALAEATDYSTQVSLLKMQNQDLARRYEEKEGAFVLLTNQFDILGKEFIDLKKSKAAEMQDQSQFIQSLTHENEILKDKLLHCDVKFKGQLSTQQELNDLLRVLQGQLSESVDALASEQQKATEAERKLLQLSAIHERELNNAKEASEGLHARVRQLAEDNSQLQVRLNESRTLDSRSLQEKHKLEAELKQSREESAAQLRESREQCQLLSKQLDDHSDIKHRLDETTNILIEKDAQIAKLMERIEQYEQTQGDVMRETKSQLQATNERIMELCGRTAALTAELTQAKAALKTAETQVETEKENQNLLKSELERQKLMIQAAKSRLQEVEDQHMLDLSKLEASNSEVAELREQLESATAAHASELANALERSRRENDSKCEQLRSSLVAQLEQSHAEAVESVRVQAQKEISHAFDASVETLRKTYEINHFELKRELTSTKANCDELLSRAAALEAELSRTKTKLNNERHRANVLQEELAAASTHTKARMSDVEGSYAREVKRLEHENADLLHEKHKLEAELFDLSKKISALQTEAAKERDDKELVRMNYESMLAEYKASCGALKKASEDATNAQREVAEWANRYNTVVQTHQTELSRISKRNQVLLDTVAKLTTQSKVEATSSVSIPSYDRGATENLTVEINNSENKVNKSSLENERWSQTPPSVLRQRVNHQHNYQRGKSAPALLSNSVEKDKQLDLSKLALNLDQSVADDEYGIQVIDTHRDGEALQRLQFQLDEYNSLQRQHAAPNSSFEDSSSISKLRAKTAPQLRSSTFPDFSNSTDDHKLSEFGAFDNNNSPYRISEARTIAFTEPPAHFEDSDSQSRQPASEDLAIQRIQNAIHQRRVQLQSRQKPTRSQAVDRAISSTSGEISASAVAAAVAAASPTERSTKSLLLKSPDHSVRFAKPELSPSLVTPVKANNDQWTESSKSNEKQLSSSQTFTRKLRSSVEEGENHWIPFSPQPSQRQTSSYS